VAFGHVNRRPRRTRAVENWALLDVATTDALKGPQLETLQVDNMGLDHHHPHVLATNETLHHTPPSLHCPVS
jgi:hypothetical protein